LKPPVYLDYNGTTPNAPEVVAAMRPFLELEFGNPSSSHWYGIAPKQAIHKARHQVADLLGTTAENIIFTSGGTESNNHAIIGIARSLGKKGKHIITSQVEHPAILEVCRFLARDGFDITYLPVDGHGMVDPDAVKAAVRTDTILISVMHANNEVGTIEPIPEISKIARDRGIVMHTDASQSIGKISVRVDELGVDLLSVAGHKLYAPKGIGALYVRNGLSLPNFFHGAGQESGRRAGTENVLGIVGLGAACKLAKDAGVSRQEHLLNTRNRLETLLMEQLEEIRINAGPAHRLPNTSSISFKNLAANRVLEEIGLTVAASAGAACHSDSVQVSHVLEAIGIDPVWAYGTVRFSTGAFTTISDIEEAAQTIITAVKALRFSG
jgi:cysteine desulfurase